MPDSALTENFAGSVESANKQLKIMLVAVFLMNFVLSGSMKYMTMLVRFL